MSEYLSKIVNCITQIENEERERLDAVSRLVADTIKSDGLIFTFGCGHSHLPGLDAFYRAGGLASVSPMLDTDLMLHNGAAKSSRMEKMSGIASEVFRRYTIELGATLEDGQKDVDKHEIITDNGVGCDRVVDTQMPQDSIYVFGKNKQAFMDTDAELYGYEEIQINTIRNAFAAAKSAEVQASNIAKWAHIQKIVEGAKKSLATLENVKVGE